MLYRGYMGKKIRCSSTPRGRKSKDQGGERNQRSCYYIHPCYKLKAITSKKTFSQVRSLDYFFFFDLWFVPGRRDFKTVWATDPWLVSKEWYLDVAHGGKARKRYFQRVMPGIKFNFFQDSFFAELTFSSLNAFKTQNKYVCRVFTKNYF